MAVILISPMAKKDMAQIYNYIATASNRDRAITVLSKIRRRLKNLADNPAMGKGDDMLQPGVRMFPSGIYIIFYRIVFGGILVDRVLHGARDIPKAFWDA